ncbi:general transcription factor IIH subunit 3 isoform X1 [Syngnathoides biaculeatus]|uniref:general transcription factor IIH subunit 3 isoform X1 n=1 Tax=Syngnathoides biaculeatus TaxID=300417 RepID=UPI002ADE7829|nr:general transcription factor IIH subunit 3 isoform X1 [Syngnathoides biaculeatus]
MASEEEVSLLVIVVDVNPIWWGQQGQREPQFTLPKCMDSVMVMANAHVAMSRINKLAVIASHCKDSHFLYPSPGGDSAADDACSSGDGKYELLSGANAVIADRIRNLMSNIEVTGGSTDTMLAGSLAKALCYINRVSKELEGIVFHEYFSFKLSCVIFFHVFFLVGQEVKSRILVIKAADDCALQYMNFMNVIFAAQKQNILIDACVLESDSGLLQQACDITGGLYLKIPQKAALAQYLLWVFLPDAEQRSQLLLPPPAHVDYRAACFCHRNLIQIGYVCSVCLSIFCNFSPICTTCETAFKMQLPQMVKGKKKKFKAS